MPKQRSRGLDVAQVWDVAEGVLSIGEECRAENRQRSVLGPAHFERATKRIATTNEDAVHAAVLRGVARKHKLGCVLGQGADRLRTCETDGVKRLLCLVCVLAGCGSEAGPARSEPVHAPPATPAPEPAPEARQQEAVTAEETPAAEGEGDPVLASLAGQCAEGMAEACGIYVRRGGSAATVLSQRSALLQGLCTPCVTGLEAACDPYACRALDANDARVVPWLEARCEDTHLDLLPRGRACISAADQSTSRDFAATGRRGAQLLERACRAGSYEACADMAALYFDGRGPGGEMNEARGDERGASAHTLSVAACEAHDARACLFVEYGAASLAL